MTKVMIGRRGLAIAALLMPALLIAAGCGKKANDTSAQSSGAIAPPAQSSSLQVADVSVGRSLGSDKAVATPSTTFTPGDTIYASVHTTGTAQNSTLTARWTFQDGQLVNERSESISPSGDAHTEFHISKPTP